jgi:hypothetical protein
VTGSARRLRFVALACAVALPLVAAPGDARATTATIKRSVQNLLLFPVDFALSPYVASKALYERWSTTDDTKAVKYAYALPAIPWSIGVNMGASVLRGVAGALEFLPGLVLIPFDADMNQLFDPAENNAALFDSGEDNFARARIGVDYVSPSSY